MALVGGSQVVLLGVVVCIPRITRVRPTNEQAPGMAAFCRNEAPVKVNIAHGTARMDFRVETRILKDAKGGEKCMTQGRKM